MHYNGGDPLESSSWDKSYGPVFTQANGVFGTGHNCNFLSPDGTEIWVRFFSFFFRVGRIHPTRRPVSLSYAIHIGHDYSDCSRSFSSREMTSISSPPLFPPPSFLSFLNLFLLKPTWALSLIFIWAGQNAFHATNISTGHCGDERFTMVQRIEFDENNWPIFGQPPRVGQVIQPPSGEGEQDG